MVSVKSLRSFDDERNVPQLFAHHGLPQRGGGEKRGQCGAIRAKAANTTIMLLQKASARSNAATSALPAAASERSF